MADEFLIDFDKIFEAYVVDWYSEHGEDYENIEEVEDIMPDIYAEWADSPSKLLGGIAPRAFFEKINDANKLIGILVNTSEGDNNPCSLLLDRIAEVKSCETPLCELIRENRSVKLTMLSINLISEMGGAHPLETYIEKLFDGKSDEDVRELCIEILAENANAVASVLFGKLSKADKLQKEYIAEILVNADKNDATYELLIELFQKGNNIPLYAGYLGKYGDERAMPILYKALDNSNYLEFLEIKNAIERMGGIVDDDYKDFSQDKYFKAIKLTK